MNLFRSLVLATLIMVVGCTHPSPRVTVDVLDTILSITPRAEHAAETALLDQIALFGPGDGLILIPITGDAENDAGGRILRLVVPIERQAYDNDLRQFGDEHFRSQGVVGTFGRRDSRGICRHGLRR
jgi:hypothetical protein